MCSVTAASCPIGGGEIKPSKQDGRLCDAACVKYRQVCFHVCLQVVDMMKQLALLKTALTGLGVC